MYSIVDTHCHLDIVENQGLSITDSVKNAAESGVTDIIQIGIDFQSSQKAQEISQTFSDNRMTIHYTQGLHPTDIQTAADFTELEALIRKNHNDPLLVGIGEIGLDLYHDTSRLALQEETLNRFLQLASELSLPVVIHSRDAAEETYRALHNFKDQVFGVIHCFTYDYEYAKRFVDLGYYISFSGIVAFKNAREIQEAAAKLPLGSILIETDAPFLAPPPNRGKRNEPSNMLHILEKLISLREEDESHVERQIYQNSQNFIRRKPCLI